MVEKCEISVEITLNTVLWILLGRKPGLEGGAAMKLKGKI